MKHFFSNSPLGLSLIGLLLSGCTRSGPADFPDAENRDASLDASQSDTPFVRADTGPLPDAGTPLEETVIYAHSDSTLYTFSALTNAVVEVGPFTSSEGARASFMTDLAVDAAGLVFTSGGNRLWSVDPESARVTPIGALPGEINALTFLAPGELGPAETLIGVGGVNVYQIDPTTGSARMLGTYPDGYISSGDVVSVEGATYATVVRVDSEADADTLVQISFDATGRSTFREIGDIRSEAMGFRNIWGIGYWGRSVYGFSAGGNLIEIDARSGAARVVTTMTGARTFWGAGVTTRAPVLI